MDTKPTTTTTTRRARTAGPQVQPAPYHVLTKKAARQTFASVPKEPDIDVQEEPFKTTHASGNVMVVKVDLVYAFDEHVLISGWAVGNVQLAVVVDGRVVPCERITVPRPDVASAIGGAAEDLGYAIVVKAGETTPKLVCSDDEGAYRFELAADHRDRLLQCTPMLQPVLKQVSAQLEPYSDDWIELVSAFKAQNAHSDDAAGYIEASAACASTGRGLAVGWETHHHDSCIWLQDDSGRIHRIDDAFRLFRNDVYEAVGLLKGHDTARSGFVAAISDCKPGETLNLLALTDAGVQLISSTKIAQMSDSPTQAARWLFGVATPIRLLAERIAKVDIQILDPLLKNKSARDASIEVEPIQLGTQLKSPKVSVIVPLYGRCDFVEHQLMEFCQDPWFIQNVQLVYVVDDPQLKEAVLAAAQNLYALYQVPFLVVPGEVNRGFSSANNLGAQYSTGEFLVFLNSDVFPIRPGWVQDLIAPLQGKTKFGIAGAKLLYGDGSIQHAGIDFKRRDDLGIWVNHHPKMGLASSLDTDTGITEKPAVTGACMAIRRSDFDAVGGWDTGYLIGDFEDSDLCLKVRKLGMRIAYVPAACLTHLERQSFKLLGGDDFRQQVVIYNAARHQQRWVDVLEAGAAT